MKETGQGEPEQKYELNSNSSMAQIVFEPPEEEQNKQEARSSP